MRYAFFFTLILLSVSGFSQSNFRSGYIVTNKQDTLRGFVDYRERSQNPVSVFFRPELGAPTQTLTVDDCAGYSIDGIESFQRFQVTISLGQEALERLSKGVDIRQKRDKVFLKVLQRGDLVSLFYYNDEIKERYYILKKGDQEPVELIRYVFLSERGSERTVTKRYINQLQLLIRELGEKHAISEQTLLKLDYDEKSLVDIISKINNDQPQKSKNLYPRSRLFAGAGVGFNNLTFRDEALSAGAAPMVTIGADFFLNPAIRKLIFRAELSLQSAGTEVNRQGSAKVTYPQWVFEAMPQFIYNVYNADDLKFFMGLGGGLKYHWNKKPSKFITISDANLISQASAVSLRGTLGIVLYKKLEIGVGYSSIPFGYKSGYTKRDIQGLIIGVNYLFGK
jgi:hypothetical protein